MRPMLIVQFAADRAHEVPLPADAEPLAADVARRWLENEFVAHDCEPIRASGKGLTADKVLAVAAAAGESRLTTDTAWARDFARAATGALGRPLVKVDVAAGAISF